MKFCIFEPTPEQNKAIYHEGSAFISACPGAGKTRVLVERARAILKIKCERRGIAFMSFTRAAVSGLEDQLRCEALLGSPVFPHFIGTFDSFIWQFIIAPFGIPDTEAPPRLIPDKGSRLVQPYNAQPLPLSCFDRTTGTIDADAALRCGFDVSKKKPSHIKALETVGLKLQALFHERGELDFDEARALAVARLTDTEFAFRLSSALAARFREIIVDEAQDCNPEDLEIIEWLRNAGIATKVICDPHQSIYEFRGGVTDQLFAFAKTFTTENQLFMSGNFRSSDNICKAIVMFRALETRNMVDKPLGIFKNEQIPIYILSYAGKSVPGSIGERFAELLNEHKIDVTNSPVLAATRYSGIKAIGQPIVKIKRDLTCRLAEAVSDFCFAFETSNQKSAIEEIHKIILEIEGRLSNKSYHQCILAHNLKPEEWRPQMLHILRALQYDSSIYADTDAWHARAKDLLEPFLPHGSTSISQKLKKNMGIKDVLMQAPAECPPAKTIHSVKGLEFPAVCVITVAQTLNGVLDYLETGAPIERAETARELYVAVSRAQRLLAIATPKSQCERMTAYIQKSGAAVTVVNVE